MEGFRALLNLGESVPAGPDLLKCLASEFPNLKWIAGTERIARHGNRHDLSGFLWTNGSLNPGRPYQDLEIVDRVGTGDAFAAGILRGLIVGKTPRETVDFALAHAALVHTTRGDTSQFSVTEIQALADGQGAEMRR